jgi:hypothetical protein
MARSLELVVNSGAQHKAARKTNALPVIHRPLIEDYIRKMNLDTRFCPSLYLAHIMLGKW